MKPSELPARHGRAIGCALALMLGLAGIGLAKADQPETVSCDSEGMDVSDAAMTRKTCYKGDISGSTGHATIAIIVAQSSSAFLVVRRLKSGYRTYFPGRSVEEWISTDSDFRRIQDLRQRGSRSGYDTASFRGTPSSAESSPLSCFAFVHNEGNPQGETDGPAGFLRVVEGSYCKASPSTLTDSEIGAVLSSIRVNTY
jgi:hypothetical protein